MGERIYTVLYLFTQAVFGFNEIGLDVISSLPKIEDSTGQATDPVHLVCFHVSDTAVCLDVI